jgi:hypothetical protein
MAGPVRAPPAPVVPTLHPPLPWVDESQSTPESAPAPLDELEPPLPPEPPELL